MTNLKEVICIKGKYYLPVEADEEENEDESNESEMETGSSFHNSQTEEMNAINNTYSLQSIQNTITESDYINDVEKKYPRKVQKIIDSYFLTNLRKYKYLLKVW
jgi:hypothetical protein